MTIYERWINKEKGYRNFSNFQTTILKAYSIADGDNKQKLEKAFPEWFVKGKPKVLIGFQICHKEEADVLPKPFNDWEVLSERMADDWLKENNDPDEWEKVEIFDQDIEDPKFFDGSAGSFVMSARPSINHPRGNQVNPNLNF
jgi:hypothetical protein